MLELEKRMLELEKATAIAYLDMLNDMKSYGAKWAELAERVSVAEATGVHYRLIRVKNERGYCSASIELVEDEADHA